MKLGTTTGFDSYRPPDERSSKAKSGRARRSGHTGLYSTTIRDSAQVRASIAFELASIRMRLGLARDEGAIIGKLIKRVINTDVQDERR
jgi:hypothetical protein